MGKAVIWFGTYGKVLPADGLVGGGFVVGPTTTTPAAGTHADITWSTAQTNDALIIGVDETSRTVHIADFGDQGFNFANSAFSHPTLVLHSSAQSTSQFATISQTGTNLEIKNTGAAASTTVFTGGANGIALQSASDANILVGGGGFLYFRSTASGMRQNTGMELAESSAARGYWLSNSRFQTRQGADVASLGDLTLGTDGNVFEITGTTTINAITTTNYLNGAVVTLLFTSTPTVKHNTAGGASTAVFLLAGAADFVASAGDTLTLVYSEIGGTNAWREIGRAVI